jgi:Tetracyclin repressor-like, C-terminal domain
VNTLSGNLANFHVRLSAVPEYQGKLRLVIESSLMDLVLHELEEPERAIRADLVTTPLMGLAFVRYVWKVDPIASMSDEEMIVPWRPTFNDSSMATSEWTQGPTSQPRLLKRLCDTKTPWRSLEDSVSYGNLEREPREGIEISLASCGTVARLGLISSLVG